MAGSPPVVVHLGAHKTATTHLQHALAQVRGRFEGRLFLPKELRASGLRLQEWLSGESEGREHHRVLRQAFAVPVRLVISEENILGVTPGVFEPFSPLLYPRAEPRLRRLVQVLPDRPVILALAMREGAGFMVSCYAQALLAGRVMPFDDFRAGVDPTALDWSGLVARLRAALPEAQIVLWNYAEWPQVGAKVAARLLGPEAELALPQARPHERLSATAVAVLLSEAPRTGAEAAARARLLRARFPRQAGHPPFQPFDEDTRRRAEAALREQLASLAKQPGIELLRAHA